MESLWEVERGHLQNSWEVGAVLLPPPLSAMLDQYRVAQIEISIHYKELFNLRRNPGDSFRKHLYFSLSPDKPREAQKIVTFSQFCHSSAQNTMMLIQIRHRHKLKKFISHMTQNSVTFNQL
jgi:hypothetical protein